jgi:hypothetical protein
MRRSATLWVLAVLLTLASAVWQRLTGPSYPVRFDREIGPVAVAGKLLRTHVTGGDLPVHVRVEPPDARDGAPVDPVTGAVFWRRYPTSEAWRTVPLQPADDGLRAALPHQPPAGKIEYWLQLRAGAASGRIPAHEAAVARFKGAVPPVVLGVHIAAMFFAMLVSLRAGFEALVRGPDLRRLGWLTLLLLAAGGLVLGPVVQKHAFGAYWTGWPLGEDLTDNKLAVAVLAWGLAVWRLRAWSPGNPRGRWWAVAAALVVAAIFAVPHSLHGSTLDYATMEHVQG